LGATLSQVPEHVSEEFSKTLLGRLKLRLFGQIAGGEESLPSDQMIRHFIADQCQSNATVGMLLFLLLTTKSSGLTEYDQLREPDDLEQLLYALDEKPLEQPCFLEIRGCPEALPGTLGALVYCEELLEGGYVYIVTLMDEAEFLERFAGRAEIRSSQVAPEPAFGILEQGGYADYSLDDYRDYPLAVFLTKVLNFVEQNRAKHFIPVMELSEYELKERPELNPPPDRRFQALLRLVACEKILCTEAEIGQSLIRPYSFDLSLAKICGNL
jgi:hypothetical protein